MAKYLGLLTSDLRGAIGGIVGTHGRNGTNLRCRVAPVRASSVAQNTSRTALASASSQWNAITSAARASWNSLAALNPRTNSLGQSFYLTGQQLWSLRQLYASYTGLTYSSTAPATYPSITTVAAVYVSCGVNPLSITVVATGGSYLVPALMSISRPLTAGTSYVGRSLCKYVGTTTGTALKFNILAAYEALYGTSGVVGMLSNVLIQPLDPTYGLPGTRWLQQVAAISG